MQLGPTDTFVEDGDGQEYRDSDLFRRPSKMRVTLSQPSALSRSETDTDWRNTGNGYQGFSKGNGRSSSRHNSYNQEDDVSWDPELDKENDSLTIPRVEKRRYPREEKRTILAKNLSDRATHKDVVDFVRGGLVLDIYLRLNERSVSISFVEGSAAQDFMNFVKKNDIYVHGKRVCSDMNHWKLDPSR